MIILGYDPGGEGNNGAAILRTSNTKGNAYQVGTFDHADDTLDWFVEELKDQIPSAAGIDTLLNWLTGRKGWRPQDDWLERNCAECFRDRLDKRLNSIKCSFELFGCMSVQGMAMANRLRDYWPSIHLNEACLSG